MNLTPQEIERMRAHMLQERQYTGPPPQEHTIIEVRERPVPLLHKPGRWVPPILFLVWVGLTAIFPTMLLWFFLFVPVAFWGWHWGMGNRNKNNNTGLSASSEAVSSLMGNSPHIHP